MTWRRPALRPHPLKTVSRDRWRGGGGGGKGGQWHLTLCSPGCLLGGLDGAAVVIHTIKERWWRGRGRGILNDPARAAVEVTLPLLLRGHCPILERIARLVISRRWGWDLLEAPTGCLDGWGLQDPWLIRWWWGDQTGRPATVCLGAEGAGA